MRKGKPQQKISDLQNEEEIRFLENTFKASMLFLNFIKISDSYTEPTSGLQANKYTAMHIKMTEKDVRP